ncbi:ABC transporter ATP-binding protein [Allopusillimonas ginsengisoli]|uniref:ABC transporter ATP-binding protein n=1 Tax=Allopusillimonas ginsengisoli TaxID=453575 RepID=UPI0010C18947|nr:ABC transporter ATP-binding protein [Allopusillimonas ginsengisoli]
MKLSFNNIEKQFSRLPVIENFSRDIADGELVALVGPSGCGKSTLLHMVAGLERPSAGQLLADGAPIAGPHPSRTLMFQENALYPWMTLVQNVALALEFQGAKKKIAQGQAYGWLEKVNLKGFETYYPHQVSGGMRQRAALARAFISRPQALLLDEPFGALDALTRLTLQDVLRELLNEAAPTVLLVTHDVDEALFLADRILVFSSRPATVLKEFKLHQHTKTHDLSQFAALRSEILVLLGIEAHAPDTSEAAASDVAARAIAKANNPVLVTIPEEVQA